MTDRTLADEIYEKAKQLDDTEQQRVLEFMSQLKRPRGTPGYLAVQYAEEFNFSKEDLAEIEEALKDFEEIDLSEWDLPS
jgi:hypothetical protein